VEGAVTSSAILPRVDHLVYATADLDLGIEEVEALLGIRAVPGGRHAAWGTCNALVGLGPRCYLEILAPDPDHSPGPAGRLFALETLGSSRLLTWVANGTALETLRDSAAREGVVLGDVLSGERQRPDGAKLRWTLTDPRRVLAAGVVPFFIDWGQSPHPALLSPAGATLVSLHAEHPEAERVRGMLRTLDLELTVQDGPAPALFAEIECPNGRVVLR
jgi:hypothetical protein